MLISEKDIKVKPDIKSNYYINSKTNIKNLLNHFRRPYERPFLKSERDNTTLLFGGLTWKHEKLLQGFFEGLGYKCQPLPNPDLDCLQIGKEYCDPGCCNPTYFTCGSLIRFLKGLEKGGLSRSEIIDKYVFFTAGSCGPCRFGMYESQYRLALNNAGFEGFRVLVFQQSEGFDQRKENAGLEMNPDFFIGILICFILADLANDLAFQIRPYEIFKGETNKVLNECIEFGYQKLRECKKMDLNVILEKIPGVGRNFIKFSELIFKIIHQYFSKDYKTIVKFYKEKFSTIKVDYLKPKPIVKIIGEFWAMTTEGDGNFRMHEFLEEEGAQVIPEALGNWILYISHQTRLRLNDQIIAEKSKYGLIKRFKKIFYLKLNSILLSVGEKIYQSKHNRFRKILNYKPVIYAPQNKLRKYAEGFFNPRIEGGEGHLEVGKTIFYTKKNVCNMFVSLKPFGCMPSQQSDGVMSAVSALYPDILFLPVETSGEGAINAYSRVQMMLSEAGKSVKNEVNNLLESKRIDIRNIKSFQKVNPDFSMALFKFKNKYISTAANYINKISEMMLK